VLMAWLTGGICWFQHGGLHFWGRRRKAGAISTPRGFHDSCSFLHLIDHHLIMEMGITFCETRDHHDVVPENVSRSMYSCVLGVSFQNFLVHGGGNTPVYARGKTENTLSASRQKYNRLAKRLSRTYARPFST
jgi:hypothetical protein